MDKTIPYFGAIDLAAPYRYYEADYLYEVGGRFDEIDLSLALHTTDVDEHGATMRLPVRDLDPAVLDRVAQFAGDMDRHIERTRAAVSADFHTGGVVRTGYIAYLQARLPPGWLEHVIYRTDGSLPVDERMLLALELSHITLYPLPDPSDPPFAVFAFTIGDDVTGAVVAARLRQDGTIRSIGVIPEPDSPACAGTQ
ncbi:DUF2004 domain-containing protein [Massilia sp. CCM 8734]|uniref:DUF2004 domain-containing protein n=1 Tax=Massilia sp. CCM 8734 TaxID=2609283 RepID=UPI001424408F|nr:DUF2004 domain-containing protein [Massilia sp. CCM 8734]NHZ96609.1 DUF2004 domain-containing protein [Massilia sp. CCM 8734]